MVKIKCHRCGYEWKTKSDMISPTCPSCRRAVKKEVTKHENNHRKNEEGKLW